MRQVLFYLYLSFIITFSACDSQTNEKELEKGEKTTLTQAIEKPTAIVADTASTSTKQSEEERLSTFFDPLSIQQLLAVKQDFDSQLCAAISHSEISDCYETHASILMLDVSQKIPFTSNFPYTSNFSLQNINEEVANLDMLSDKCGFQDAKTGKTLNYYCLMNKSPFMDYVAALAQHNSFINQIHAEYQSAKGLTPNIRSSLAMMSSVSLDFEQLGHQLFYMTMHLAMNEELIASRKFRAMNNN